MQISSYPIKGYLQHIFGQQFFSLYVGPVV
jgi:hypothetical protein